MSMKDVLHYDKLFFWMGCFNAPNNPEGFPNTFPLTLQLNKKLGLLSQKASPKLQSIMDKTYTFGSTVGNAMDDSPLGKAYCDDFLSFCEEHLKADMEILEIGAGRGYMAAQLLAKSYNIDAIEPGEINKPYWKKYNINVIQDVFPSEKAPGPYDAIIFYGVLEHISDLQTFLSGVASHLKPGGVALLSVPDCKLEIEGGDPSMLLHEHYHYFYGRSLERTLNACGFSANIQKSSYGRSLYAVLRQKNSTHHEPPTQSELSILENYGKSCGAKKEMLSQRIEEVTANGSLGIYCPARVLSILPNQKRLRFFDDSEDIHKKYYPPFDICIENQFDLLSSPVDQLWIMSQTFGERIWSNLRDAGYSGEIVLSKDMFNDVN